jgi:hypothetical protein
VQKGGAVRARRGGRVSERARASRRRRRRERRSLCAARSDARCAHLRVDAVAGALVLELVDAVLVVGRLDAPEGHVVGEGRPVEAERARRAVAPLDVDHAVRLRASRERTARARVHARAERVGSSGRVGSEAHGRGRGRPRGRAGRPPLPLTWRATESWPLRGSALRRSLFVVTRCVRTGSAFSWPARKVTKGLALGTGGREGEGAGGGGEGGAGAVRQPAGEAGRGGVGRGRAQRRATPGGASSRFGPLRRH